MSEYRCESCAIYCECKIPNECDFVPEVCLAQLDKQHYEPKWEKIDEPALDTKQEKCPLCLGEKYTWEKYGSMTQRINCPACNGTGTMGEEEKQ